jgi:hypothetical protein
MANIFNYGSAQTYIKIASYTISSSISSYTFSNIPQGYTDLIVKLEVTGTSSGEDAHFQFNGDTGTNYSSAWFRSVSNTPTTTSTTGITGARLGDGGSQTTGNTTLITTNIQNYSSSLTFKNIIFRTDNASRGLDMGVSVWRSLNPITSLKVYLGVGNLSSGIINVYGIKAAISPKASGGDIIVQNGQYWYHAFRTTGAFVPRQALTVDYLVVAGGGAGGGGSSGGGGGAGGLRSTVTATGGGGTLETALSLTAGTTYTATVGAGGAIGVKGSNSVFSTITSLGGGASTNLQAEMDGGSGAGQAGGGGDPSSYKKGVGTANQGYGGGSAYHAGSYYPAGGGGGAGAVGGNIGSASQAGNGGVGVAVSITGSSVFYAGGGGGGGQFSGTAGTGGNGGGGAGSILSNGTSGTAGTGGGGGGCGYNGTPGNAGTGGSGIVIVRYSI